MSERQDEDLLADFWEESDEEPPRRRRRRRRIVLGVSLAFVIAVVGVIGGYAFMLNNSLNQIEDIPDAFPDDSNRPAEFEPDDGEDPPVNILMLGTDTRASGDSLLTDLGSRADTIMLMHIPADRESIQLMSFMRDLWVDLPGYGDSKINAALAHGGVPLMVETIEGVVDQRIDHVVIIDFHGFEGLTDELGGVTVTNDVAFSTAEHQFDEGRITLNGEEALAFVRERYAFPDGDYQRVQNQRTYLTGMMNQILSRDVLTNPLRIYDLADTMSPYLATSDTFSMGTMVSLARSIAGVDSSDVNTFTIPTLGTGTEGDQSVVYPNWEGIEEISEAMASASMTDFEPAPAQ